MLEQFSNQIQRQNLCKTTDKILVAVSGGLDSMVLLRLFVDAGFKPAVVHCNFGLRGEDSEEDERFVRTTAERERLTFFSRQFDTASIATARKESIQTTARELRYAFFHELAARYHYDKVATAHHANDNLETVLINLTRGTGIEGLAGIPENNGIFIRPLLFASRDMIAGYAREKQIAWREDVSNATDDYNRNFLRHHVVPLLKQLNPSLEKTFTSSAERISGATAMMHQAIQVVRGQLVTEQNSEIRIDKPKLLELPYPQVVLWEMVKEHGFNYDTCKQIVQTHHAGRKFFAGEQVLFVDRDSFVVRKMRPGDPVEVSITVNDNHVNLGALQMSVQLSDDVDWSDDRAVAYLDASRIRFPLLWRKWQPGDTMVPLGMKFPKKVSDILTDAQVPSAEKADATVVLSGDEIIWLPGVRISEHHRITETTSKALILRRLN